LGDVNSRGIFAPPDHTCNLLPNKTSAIAHRLALNSTNWPPSYCSTHLTLLPETRPGHSTVPIHIRKTPIPEFSDSSHPHSQNIRGRPQAPFSAFGGEAADAWSAEWPPAAQDHTILSQSTRAERMVSAITGDANRGRAACISSRGEAERPRV